MKNSIAEFPCERDSTCGTLRSIVSEAKTPKAPTIPSDIDKTPVAKDIWCYSTKEKTFTWHVVVNHDAKGFVDKVQCKTSGVVHKYKKQNKTTASSTVKKPRKTTKRSTTPAVDLEEVWYSGVRNWGDAALKKYSPATPLEEGDVFEHSTFGKGVVHARRDNKIDVVFKEGPKVLLNAK
ncbi:MAG: hypothetical protein R3A80_01020 [Bdellovibrionota bacterium]